MDEIIEKIYSKITKNDLLLITGDHEMADQGGHGGLDHHRLKYMFQQFLFLIN